MSFLQAFYNYSIAKRKQLRFLIVFSIVFLIVSFLIGHINFSPKVADFILPFDISTPGKLPFEPDNDYANIAGLDRTKIVYENESEELVLWITTDIGWNNISDWETSSMDDGTTAYFKSIQDTKILSWQKNDLEYALDYSGQNNVSKKDLLEIANSMK